MKTAIINAKIYVEKGVFAEAVFQEDGIIKAVGTNDEILALCDSETDKIDAEGKTVIPGLNDSHLHILQVGMNKYLPDLSGCRSVDELVSECKKFLDAHPETKFIFAQSWNDDFFYPDQKRLPTRQDIDKISTEIPIMLSRICGHSTCVNTKLLELMGLDENNNTVEGGKVDLEENGYPTGYMYEAAQGLARKSLPKYTKEEMKTFFMTGMEYAVAHGLTSLQTNDMGTVFPMHQEIYDAIYELFEEGLAPLRYLSQVGCYTKEDIDGYVNAPYFQQSAFDDRFNVGPVKMFRDGSLGARSAEMRKDYADDPGNKGVIAISDEMQDYIIKTAHAHGAQVVSHCIGDGAIENTVKHYIDANAGDKDNAHRHSIIHCQITDKALMEQMRENNIYIQYQPIFIPYDSKICAARVGEELASTSYCFKTAMEMGIHSSFGTDSPVEDCNPFPNIFAAVNRTDLEGKPEGGWTPSEKMSVEDCIDAYTVQSAWNEFRENVKGRIKPGFYADMVVLDTDIFTCDPMKIKDILPEMTMVAGHVVYQK